MMLRNNPTLQQSLLEFGQDFGADVLALPIHTFDGKSPWPAYTTADGIYVHKKVIVHEPWNLKIYLGHEIMHHVFDDKEGMHVFHPRVRNYAEDYKINQLLYELFGYDVRKVKYEGLFNSKFDSMTTVQVAQHLAARLPPHKMDKCCGTTGISHPLILASAHRLRLRYADKLQRKTEDHFFVDLFDRTLFYKALRKLGLGWKLRHLPFIDPSKVMLGVWSHLFLENVSTPRLEHARLTSSEVIAYGMSPRALRLKTVGKSDEAILAASIYLSNIDNDKKYLEELQSVLSNRIVRLKHKRDKIKPTLKNRAERQRLTERIHHMCRKLAVVVKLTPMPELLANSRLPKIRPASKIPTSTTVSLRNQHSKVRKVGTVRLPNFDKANSKLLRRLSSASRRSRKDYDLTLDTFNGLRELMPELTEMPDVEPEDKEGTQLPTTPSLPSEEDNSEEPDESTDESSSDGEDSEDVEDTSDEMDEEDGEDVGSDDSAEDDEAEPTDIVDEDSRESPIETESTSSATGAGKGQGGNTRIEVLQAVFKNRHYMSRLITRVQEIQSKLKSSPSRDHDPDGLVPVSLSYGNDLENVMQSEIALLSSEDTALEFLVRYSNHSLLVNTPAKNKRSPVAFCIDGSGSMMGAFYLTAVAFTLAMMMKLHKDGRGSALVLFSSTVTNSIVLRPGQKIEFVDLINALCSPAFGGTCFDAALLKAFEIKEQEEWKDFITMLVTDGYDTISPSVDELLKAHKSTNDKVIAVITSNLTEIAHVDEIHHVRRKDSELTLTSVGNSIL